MRSDFSLKTYNNVHVFGTISLLYALNTTILNFSVQSNVPYTIPLCNVQYLDTAAVPILRNNFRKIKIRTSVSFAPPPPPSPPLFILQLLKEHLQSEGQWLTRYGSAPEPSPGTGAGVVGGAADGDVGFMGVEAMTR